jgi:glycosyltransferase involved in cell wall biosynthesis
MTIRIGLALDAQRLWEGGVSYYENLLSAVQLVRKPNEHRLIGLLSGSEDQFGNLICHFDEVYNLPGITMAGKAKDRLAQMLTSTAAIAWLTPEATFSQYFRKHNVDVAFLTKDPLANFRIPKVCWFPDFQYLHYPDMFTPNDYKTFDQAARNIARFADRIVLNSNAVREDFLRIAPAHAGKLIVLRFVAWIEEEIYADSPELVAQKYHLPPRFFYLPNQFWKHKNHRVVLDALVLAKAADREITVVSSGALEDYRDRHYPSEFVASISSCGARDRFILLGLIPRRHVYGLMRQSLAVLQPSLFEGWSSSIEEAKSLGKQVIASDIPVHREQDAPGADYFNPQEPHQLADLLVKHFHEGRAGPNPEREQVARQAFLARAESFGKAFLRLMSEAARSRDARIP